MGLNGKVVFSSGCAGDFDIWSLNLDSGDLDQLTVGTNYNDHPRWSPDGSKIAFLCTEEDMIQSLWVMDANGRNKQRLTHGLYCESPAWSPDGRDIAVAANVPGSQEIELYSVSSTTGERRPLLRRAGAEAAPAWFPDGKSILFSVAPRLESGVSGRNTDLWEYEFASGRCTQLTSHPAQDSSPTISPDGTRIAFISHRNDRSAEEYSVLVEQITAGAQQGNMRSVDEAIRKLQAFEGDGDVYVMNRDGSNVRALTSDEQGDGGVCWSPCGNYLMYTSGKMGGAKRLRIIAADTGKGVPFDYDREPLQAELRQGQKIGEGFLLRLIPQFMSRRLMDRSLWGTERHPHWTK